MCANGVPKAYLNHSNLFSFRRTKLISFLQGQLHTDLMFHFPMLGQRPNLKPLASSIGSDFPILWFITTAIFYRNGFNFTQDVS